MAVVVAFKGFDLKLMNESSVMVIKKVALYS